jgi:hypothetical protein
VTGPKPEARSPKPFCRIGVNPGSQWREKVYARGVPYLATVFWLLTVPVAAGQPLASDRYALDARAIADALVIGQSPLDGERARFHAPYRLLVARPPIDYVEVVTPFRRVVLAAETRARMGDRAFGQRQALELLRAAPDQVDLWVELTFHPLNAYVGVPAYEVLLAGAERAIPPRRIDRVPRYGARVQGAPRPVPAPAAPLPPRGSQPMLGGTVVAGFDGRLIGGETAFDAVVVEEGRTLARIRIDLARLR